ncbi:MAG: VWA domain-containing protein [Deltaproteobacteria bacterium]|nr:VWA domain-containing protein [Deltaproteobacteria bacterium]
MSTAADRLFLLCLVVMFIGGCSDANLYGKGLDDPSADRLGLTGRVCTEDPREAGFPVRVVFLVDTAIGPMFSPYDPERLRLRALRETLTLHAGNEAFSFAVIGFGSRSRLLAPEEGYFSRNPGDLEDAVASLALPQGCVGEVCRDYGDALDAANALIEGDLADMNAGERSRTQYAVVMMVGGPPNPYACSHECQDPGDDGYDDTVCTLSVSCTETLLRDQVIKIRDDVEGKGASSFSLHVLFLAASAGGAPDAGTGGDLENTESILQEMAFTGAGRFERFNSADSISLDRIGLTKLTSLLEAKSLLVTNSSALPGVTEPRMDSDGDGLDDDIERKLKTEVLSGDSDGDGIGDLVETLISFDPLNRDEPPTSCVELEGPPYADSDGDRLNDCEELLLGIDPSLPDTDGDAVVDWLEVTLGTDYIRADTLNDSDGDGALNGDEAREHTDPRSSDAAAHLGSAYRYEITDEGLVVEPSITKPRRTTGVTILAMGEETTAGIGTLNYTPGPPAKLSWKDPQDVAPGSMVTIENAGQYEISSSSVESGGLERWITVEVDPILLSPTMAQESLLVELSERQCLSFTVRNIRLVETEGAPGGGGLNDVFIYFAQAPKGRLTLPGLFRVAHIPVTYHPKTGRVPNDPLVEVKDEEFAAIAR